MINFNISSDYFKIQGLKSVYRLPFSVEEGNQIINGILVVDVTKEPIVEYTEPDVHRSTLAVLLNKFYYEYNCEYSRLFASKKNNNSE